MTKNPNDLSNIPYAPWLENALKELLTFPVKGICINAVGETGEVYTNCHNISMRDKLVIAGLLQQDATIQALAINGYITPPDTTQD